MSELNQEEQQQEEVRENSEQDTLKLGVSRRTFIGAGMTAAAAALVLPRQAQGITELIEDHGAGAEDLGLQPGEKVGIKDIYKPVAFCSPVFSVPPNQWEFKRDSGSGEVPVYAPERLEARRATLTYTGIPDADEADIRNAPDSDPAPQSAEVRVFYDPDVQSPDGGGSVQSPDGGGSVDHMEVLLGPTIICDRGGIIDFELTNYLPAQDFDEASCHELHEKNLIEGSSDSGCFEEFSMHFHGLHVSPRSSDPNGSGIEFSSDHIFAPLVPYNGVHNPLGPEGKKLYTKRRFRLAIPEFHAPGTHWYHTHLHGTTAVQTSNGMAGAIIIRKEGENKFIRGEDESTNLVVDDEDDRIWLIQEFVPEIQKIHDGEGDSDEDFYSSRMGDAKGRFLVNGQYVPTLNITEGCPQRWRFINATGTPRGPMQLKLYKLTREFENCNLDRLHEMLRGKPETETEEKVPGMLVGDQEAMYLIAVDGISFYGHYAQEVGPGSNHYDYKEGWKFAPGNRADFLVNLEEGQYYVLRDQYMKSDDDEPGVGNQYKITKTEYRQVLGFINVVHSNLSCVDSDLSCFKIVDDRPNYLRPICDTELQNSPADQVGCRDTPRIIDFAVKGKGLYEINSEQFNENVREIKVALNTAERWLLRNLQCDDDYFRKSAPHPFHIHVNPFQVEGELIDPNPDRRDENDPDNWRWRDVLAVDFEYNHPSDPGGQGVSGSNSSPYYCAAPEPGLGSPPEPELGSPLGDFGSSAGDYANQEYGTMVPALEFGENNDVVEKGYKRKNNYKMIRNRFADFDGEYVVHCHILIHEDQGMMRKLIVRETGTGQSHVAQAPGVVLKEGQENTDPTCPTENGNYLES